MMEYWAIYVSMLFQSHRPQCFSSLICVLRTSFYMPSDFTGYEVVGVAVPNSKFHFLLNLLRNEKLSLSCFIRFILYWSCMFPCDTYAGLLARSL